MSNDLMLPEDDPFFPTEAIYPKLNPEMVERSLQYGTLKSYEAVQTITSRGDREVSFLVVLAGSVVVTGPGDGGHESVVTIHTKRQFSGELNLFSQREVLVTTRAVTSVKLLEIAPRHFREFVFAEPDIGEMIIRAVILRRMPGRVWLSPACLN